MKNSKYWKLRRLSNLLLILFIPGYTLGNTNCNDTENLHLVSASVDNKKKIGIVHSNFLTIRADPFIYATKFGFLEKGEQVDILNRSRKKERISGKTSYWYKIKKANGIIGWVSGLYINILEVGDESAIEELQSDLHEKEINKIEKLLYGKFWSVNNQGIYTNEKIYFFKEFKYTAGRINAKMREGFYTILPATNEIEFDEGSTVGDKISYILTGVTLTLYGKRYKRTIRLIKGDINPSAKDVMKEELLPDSIQKELKKIKKAKTEKNKNNN